MKNLMWVSRHPLTNGQKALLPLLGYEGEERIEVVFGDNPIDDLRAERLSPGREVGLVAPTFVSLALLRAGYALIEFVNQPSSRQRGVFICKGAWRHTLAESQFFPCPLAIEEQEEGNLAPGGGR